ncbi:lysylphosphatidylglycerol synthase domain-containing protein [Blastococcus saxobsidens]|uniref:Uncharacterized protein n=1 Tax=Blastococcus saxobsidens (strain DD2) TaxID=1146883 RepID=H6RKZ2_BLASD|nr:lysylphosphatidylglycerol synthase domain-containing protein [Blastococcus saxobsidens]CCG04959.1 conserved membrane protein of unknown function [Blastococcus saxobsidens DD2]
MKRSRVVVAALRWLFIGGVVGVITWQVARQWDAVRDAMAAIGPWGVLGSVAATVVGLGATGVAWRMLLAGLGSPLRSGAAAGIFFVAQLGKYLPGSVWPYVAQARIGRAHGVPASRSATAGVLFVLLHCATGAVVAAATLPLVGDRTIEERFGWLPWVIPVFLVLLHPRVVHASLARLHRVTGRGTPPGRLPWSALLPALAALAVAWIAYGAALFLLVAPLAGASWQAAVLSVGGFALAWTVGFVAAAVLVVAAPAGLGVRELALYSVLAPVLAGGPATAVVVFSRVGQLLGDVIWAAAGGAWARRLGGPVPEGAAVGAPSGVPPAGPPTTR